MWIYVIQKIGGLLSMGCKWGDPLGGLSTLLRWPLSCMHVICRKRTIGWKSPASLVHSLFKAHNRFLFLNRASPNFCSIRELNGWLIRVIIECNIVFYMYVVFYVLVSSFCVTTYHKLRGFTKLPSRYQPDCILLRGLTGEGSDFMLSQVVVDFVSLWL